eukprot:6204933-Pleurochrysis_carterae.AAC.1
MSLLHKSIAHGQDEIIIRGVKMRITPELRVICTRFCLRAGVGRGSRDGGQLGSNRTRIVILIDRNVHNFSAKEVSQFVFHRATYRMMSTAVLAQSAKLAQIHSSLSSHGAHSRKSSLLAVETCREIVARSPNWMSHWMARRVTLQWDSTGFLGSIFQLPSFPALFFDQPARTQDPCPLKTEQRTRTTRYDLRALDRVVFIVAVATDQ